MREAQRRSNLAEHGIATSGFALLAITSNNRLNVDRGLVEGMAMTFSDLRKPELMAPAGDMISLRAALEAGADAVYFGVVSMNMRASARNFAACEMPEISRLCHEYGAKAYLAMNTIVYDSELELAETLVEQATAAGIDAIICWDFAILDLALRYGIAAFVSTQMSVANSAALAFLYRHFGVKRFVLARECTLDEIVSIRRNLLAQLGDEAARIELEVFAHGAMCVSVSGRCFMSQIAFNQSANRGECRQPCRREYEIRDLRDGKEFVLGKDYVMSPRDLCTLPFLDKLLVAGIDSFKIEGRGRSPEYVSEVTACYRAYTDFYFAHHKDADFTARSDELKEELMKRLDAVFPRAFILAARSANGAAAMAQKLHIAKCMSA